jgi:hypothetical protein
MSNPLGREHSQHKRPHRRSSHGFREQVRYDPSRDGSFDTCECALNESGGDDGCYVGSESLREEEDHDPAITFSESGQSFALTAAAAGDKRIVTHRKVKIASIGLRPNVSETGANTRGPIPSMAK